MLTHYDNNRWTLWGDIPIGMNLSIFAQTDSKINLEETMRR